MKNLQKLGAVLAVCAMLCSVLPALTFADDTATTTDSTATSTATTTPDTAATSTETAATSTSPTATSTPSSMAFLSLSIYSGAPGTAFNALGSNFDALETVNIGFGGATTTATADASGNFSTPLTVPSDMASGSAAVTAIGATSGLVATNSFFVEPASATTTASTTGPVIAEVTPVPTPSDNTTPSYTFSSSEAGNITLGGGCSTSVTSTDATTTTITFNALSADTYNCTLTVTDADGNVSNTLNITPFTITAPPVVVSTTNTSSGGGGGGGGMIFDSGPLAPGYVNTNPQPNVVATAAPAPVAQTTPAPQPVAVTTPGVPNTGVPSTETITPLNISSGSGGAALSSAPAPVTVSTSNPLTISSSSSSTPGLPNTGVSSQNSQTAAAANSGVSGWLVAAIIIVALVLIGGALLLSRGV